MSRRSQRPRRTTSGLGSRTVRARCCGRLPCSRSRWRKPSVIADFFEDRSAKLKLILCARGKESGVPIEPVRALVACQAPERDLGEAPLDQPSSSREPERSTDARRPVIRSDVNRPQFADRCGLVCVPALSKRNPAGQFVRVVFRRDPKLARLFFQDFAPGRFPVVHRQRIQIVVGNEATISALPRRDVDLGHFSRVGKLSNSHDRCHRSL